MRIGFLHRVGVVNGKFITCKITANMLNLIAMKNTLWKFKDNNAAFVSENACEVKTLYLPLCNTSPIMSSLAPSLHGDVKTNYNSFLLEPISRVDLSNSKSSRNFWIYINPQKIWSAAGISKNLETAKFDEFKLEAGLLWQKISRQNKKIGLKTEITSFIPRPANR